MSYTANIFASDDGRHRLSEEKLQAYLEGKLSADEQREVELWLADEGMESDAMEGLQHLSINETKHSVSKLNHQLHTHIAGKKKNRKHFYKDQQWALAAIFILLLLCLLAYVVLYLAARH